MGQTFFQLIGLLYSMSLVYHQRFTMILRDMSATVGFWHGSSSCFNLLFFTVDFFLSDLLFRITLFREVYHSDTSEDHLKILVIKALIEARFSMFPCSAVLEGCKGPV